MDRETAARLVRAARVLLRTDAESFAGRLGVSIATLKRVEAGHTVGDDVVAGMVGALAGAGVVVIGPNALFPDVTVGIALLASAEIGEGSKARSDIGPGTRKPATKRRPGPGGVE